MYYKAILYNTGIFKVVTVPEEEAKGYTKGVYQFIHTGEGVGFYAIRTSKRSAIKAIKDQLTFDASSAYLEYIHIQNKIKEMNKQIRNKQCYN